MSDLATGNNLGHRDVECFIWRTRNEFLEYSSGTGMSNADRNLIAEGGSNNNLGAFSNLQTAHDATSFEEENDIFINNLQHKALPHQLSHTGLRNRKISERADHNDKSPKLHGNNYDPRYRGSIWVPAIAIIICLIVLSIPKEESLGVGEDGSKNGHWLLPDFMIVSSSENQRLIASYVLGIWAGLEIA